MNSEKKLIAYFLTIIVGVGIYTFKNLSEQRKIAKRMKRHSEFLAALEAYRVKYTGPALTSKEGKAELFKLLTDYPI
jgi:hypothetical protein